MNPNHHPHRSAAWLVAVASLFGGAPALADYGPEARDLLDKHASYALEFDSAPLVVRETTTSRDQALRDLVPLVSQLSETQYPAYDAEAIVGGRHALLTKNRSQLSDNYNLTSEVDGLTLIESEDGTTLIQPEEFSLRILNHGHAFRLVSHRNDYGKYGNAPAKLDEKDAEALGRSLIDKWGLVPADEMSQLLFQKTRYIHFTGQANDPEDRVVATSIHFGRKINGVPVVGYHGSSIRIVVIAHNDVHNIDVDWTPIRITDQQQFPLDLDGYHRRLAGLVKWNDLQDAETKQASKRIKVAIDRQVCGYFDAGAGRSNASFMQLGCMLATRTNDSLTAEVTFVPIGESVVREDCWPPTLVIDEADRLADKGALKVEIIGLPKR